MALKQEKFTLIFDKGLDTKTDPKLTQGYLQLDNCRINNISVEKSPGYDLIVDGIQPDTESPVGLFSNTSQMVSVINDDVYVFDPQLRKNIFRNSFNYLDRLTTTTTQIKTDVLDAKNQYYSEYGDFEAIGYIDLLNILKIRINDKSINIALRDIVLDNTGTRRILSMACTQNAVFVYSTTGVAIDEDIIYYDSLQPTTTTLALIPTFKTVTVAGGTAYYPFPDITTEFDGQFVWVFYVDAANALHVLIRSLFASSEATITPGFANPRAINVGTSVFNPATMCSLYVNEPFQLNSGTVISKVMLWACGSQLLIFNANNLTYSGSFINIATVAENYGQSLCVNNIDRTLNVDQIFLLNLSPREYCTPPALQSFPPRIYNVNIPAGTIALYTAVPPYFTQGGAAPVIFGTGFVGGGLYATSTNAYWILATMPYAANNSAVPANIVTNPLGIHLNYYLVDVKYNMVDHITHYLGAQKAIIRTSTVGPPPVLTNYFAVPFGPVVTKYNIVTEQTNYVTFEALQTQIAEGQVTFTNAIKTQQIFENPRAKTYFMERGKGLYFGASDLKKITPTTVDEVNFLDFPAISATYVAGAQVRNYTVTFEYIDTTGELTRSGFALPLSISTDGTAVQVYITPPSWLETKQNIVIKIWRTTLNSTLYYLLNQQVFNPLTFSAQYTDAPLADSTLRGNEVAYFNGGVAPELPFETFTTMVLHNNRAFTVKSSDQNIVQYALPFQPTVSMATSFGFEFFVEPKDGPITELASLDDKLIIFKRDFIYAVTGDGLDATANNSTLSVPTLLNSPVGCSEPLSVIRMPDGIMFKSLKGIYLLGRDLSVQYIGAPVEKFNNQTISSASLFFNQNKVRFNTYDGTTLDYDYYYETWTTESKLKLFASTVFNGVFYAIDDLNNLLATSARYYKNGHPYAMTIETPWIKTAGLQGYQRAYWLLLLGTWFAPSTIRVGISYDFVEIIEDWLEYEKSYANSYGTNQWGEQTPFGGYEKSNLEVRFNVPKQKCQAIKFTIQDEFSNIKQETGNSFNIEELSLIYGMVALDVKLPASRRT